MKISKKIQLTTLIFFVRDNARCNKLKFVLTQKQPLRGSLERRLLILVHLFVGNEHREHVIINNNDSEASSHTVSIDPGQDFDIASTEILTGILVYI